ncbi:MAG: hypothetical protein NTX82_06780 [Candidatus Parcubacteria bacterium]|nr:hypothetical protein [Candidatus Parcubacteria bacterium]
MVEIRFKVSHQPLSEEDIDYVVKRVESIVCGTGNIVQKTSGSYWGLGTGNDWWLNFNPKTQEFGLSYRYDTAPSERMQALRTTIIFVMSLQPFNQKATA